MVPDIHHWESPGRINSRIAKVVGTPYVIENTEIYPQAPER